MSAGAGVLCHMDCLIRYFRVICIKPYSQGWRQTGPVILNGWLNFSCYAGSHPNIPYHTRPGFPTLTNVLDGININFESYGFIEDIVGKALFSSPAACIIGISAQCFFIGECIQHVFAADKINIPVVSFTVVNFLPGAYSPFIFNYTLTLVDILTCKKSLST
jgi:hypothetical protein